jgi:hypothetical protein
MKIIQLELNQAIIKFFDIQENHKYGKYSWTWENIENSLENSDMHSYCFKIYQPSISSNNQQVFLTKNIIELTMNENIYIIELGSLNVNQHPSDPSLQDYFFVHSSLISKHDKETSIQFYIKLKQIQDEAIISEEEENNLENMNEEQILCHHFLEAMEKQFSIYVEVREN